MFEIMDKKAQEAVIKVIGVGGGGGNAVRHMLDKSIFGVEFILANTDTQALGMVEDLRTHRKAEPALAGEPGNWSPPTVLQIGATTTKGLGAGTKPATGREAALEDRDSIEAAIRGADMLFITAGMGGGTGTGAAPVVAEIARELGILTVAVVTKPFAFENRTKVAERGLEELSQHVDSLITIPNDKLLKVFEGLSLTNAFAAADDVLLNAVQGISDAIVRPSLINIDFADVRTVMSEGGMAMMSTGHASGENCARQATEAALKSPLLEDIEFDSARSVLFNATIGSDIGPDALQEVGETIHEFTSEQTTIVMGADVDESMGHEVRLMIVVAGMERRGRPSLVVDNAPPTKASGGIDYSKYDQPMAMRQSASGNQPENVPGTEGGDDYLDIPAFLRRQAD